MSQLSFLLTDYSFLVIAFIVTKTAIYFVVLCTGIFNIRFVVQYTLLQNMAPTATVAGLQNNKFPDFNSPVFQSQASFLSLYNSFAFFHSKKSGFLQTFIASCSAGLTNGWA